MQHGKRWIAIYGFLGPDSRFNCQDKTARVGVIDTLSPNHPNVKVPATFEASMGRGSAVEKVRCCGRKRRRVLVPGNLESTVLVGTMSEWNGVRPASIRKTQ